MSRQLREVPSLFLVFDSFLWLGLISVAVFAGSSAFAQLPTATISGVVKDSSGAVVPEASLTVRNTETGASRTAKSGNDGSCRFPAMPVGSYEIRAVHPGFQTEVRSGLTLTVAEEAVVNFTLAVGAVEQTIAVTAEAPLVNTTSGSLGGLVDEQKVADLPLNGRNYIDLTLLQTGIQLHSNRNPASSASPGRWFSSNGAPLRSNNFLLDGAMLQNIYGSTSASVTGSTLGVEGILEWRVVTNSFSAEYGMTMGSQMMIVSKSGTNNFHGSLFEYLRNSALDARNFFDRKTATSTRRLPAFTRNNFGGSFGGRIKKDKTFFFATYEALRERVGVTTVTNVIPAAAKVDGSLVPQISPVIKPLLTLYPDPNLPNNQHTFPFSQPTTENYGQMRVDQTLSASDTMFVRYTGDDAQRTTPLAYPRFKTVFEGRNQYATLSENHVFSPALLNTVRFSYSRTLANTQSPSGIIGPQFSFIPGVEIGNITIGGVTGLGPSTINRFPQDIFSLSDDLFYTRGRHSLKFGTLMNRYREGFSRNPINSVSFPNITRFLLGQPDTMMASTPQSNFLKSFVFYTYGFYAQDDLRVRPNLTLNIGLRYEFNTQPREIHGLEAALRDIQHDASVTFGPVMINSSLHNFSPRFGFAWDVRGNGKTAVRGGFGLLYDIADFGSALIQDNSGKPPYSAVSSVTNPPSFSIPFLFPPEAVGIVIRPVDYLYRQPHMLQYNLTVERQLPLNMALTVAYGGSRGINIAQIKEGNPTVPQVLPDGRQFWL